MLYLLKDFRVIQRVVSHPVEVIRNTSGINDISPRVASVLMLFVSARSLETSD